MAADDATTYYTLAQWRVREGREDEFVRMWEDDLAATFAGLEHPPLWGRLLRSTQDPRLFYSFGPWRRREDIAAMRSSSRAKEIFQAMAALCEEMHPGEYELLVDYQI